MIALADTDTLRVITSGAVAVDALVSFADLDAAGAVAFDRQRAAIATATTTTIAAAPAAGSKRSVKGVNIRNKHATTANDVTVQHFDGATAIDMIKVTLAAGESLAYDDQVGWRSFDTKGQIKTSYNATATATVNELNTVILAADVTNNNAVANTIADVTGLSFPVNAGELYRFRFVILYTAAATTTGSRWAVNGPASPTLISYRSTYTLTAASETQSHVAAFDQPAAASASSLTVGNTAIIEGCVKPSASGTLIARFASEIASSAIVAKAGSMLQWMRVA